LRRPGKPAGDQGTHAGRARAAPREPAAAQSAAVPPAGAGDRAAGGGGRMIELGVNIDHVATLRQARGTRYPDPVHAALLAEQAGADAITLHLREDRRHIQDHDVEALRQRLQTRMNLEMAATPEMIAIARRVRPHDCCLVPERREELTTEGGLDVRGNRERLARCCEELAQAGVRVSLFVDPEPEQIDAAAKTGAPAIEIHTGHYAEAPDSERRRHELGRIVRAVE